MMTLFRQPDVTGPCWARSAERPIIRRYGICVLLCTVLLPGVGLASPNATLQMTAKLTQSTCTVDVDAANGTYLLPPTRASDIWGATGTGYIQPDLTKITVTLSQCGVGDAAKTPVVTLTGPKAEAAYLKKPNGFTFRDAGANGGTARQFFIGITKTSKPTSWDGNNFYQNMDPIKFSTSVGKGESGEGATATVWAGVASGTPGNYSDKSKARAGTVTATLTFTMTYQ